VSEGAVEIEAHREAVLRHWLDSPRHTWIGLHARAHAAVHDMEGIVLDADGEEVMVPIRRRGVRDILERVFPAPRVRHPFAGANRHAKRAAAARARRRA
jgi:hypothetical protein